MSGTVLLSDNSFERWRRDPCSFITEIIVDPETGLPFQLLPAEREFFKHAFKTDDSGRLLYPEQVFAAPKKSGKTALGALHLLVTTLVYGGPYAEAYALANDLEQAQGRVFRAIQRIVESSPVLRDEANVRADRIEFPSSGATIMALASDYAGAAGSNPTISCFDELWAYTSERSRRLWDEQIPPPTRKIACRLTTTYAGFEGESLLLEELYKKGLAQPQVGADLYAGNGLLMFWSHTPIAPWQTPEWVEQMRGSLRPNAFLRMIENRFVAPASVFIDMEDYDACVSPESKPVFVQNGAPMPIWAAVDASVKRDSTAIVLVTRDRETKRVVVLNHKIFNPTPGAPVPFAEVEQVLRGLPERGFAVRGIYYDPYQMAAVAQCLQASGLPMREYPQTPANLTAMGSNLFELIKTAGIMFYPSDEIRLAMSRTVAIETERGLKLAKAKASHKIDVVIALAMASLAAVESREDWQQGLVLSQHIGVFTQPRTHFGEVGDATDTMQAWVRTQGYTRAKDGGLGRGAATRGLVW
jgi:phage terminase large subunit-like protein